MEGRINASTVSKATQVIVDKIAAKYRLINVIAKDEYVLRGDSFMFKVNNHNVYRVVLEPQDDGSTYVIFQCIKDAIVFDNGDEGYDDARDYKDEVVSYSAAFDTVVKWVNECEADDSAYTEYFDEDDNPIATI